MYSVFFFPLYFGSSAEQCRSHIVDKQGNGSPCMCFFFIIHILFVVHVHKNMVAYLSESKQPSVYQQHTHVIRNETDENQFKQNEERRNNIFFSS